jgi:predicted transcriptional regulator
MGAKKHSKDEIIYRILKACKGRGIKITRISWSSNVGFEILPKYLNYLMEYNLIEIVKIEAVLYRTIEKGYKALWYFEEFNELIPGYFPAPSVANSTDLSSRSDSTNSDNNAVRRSRQLVKYRTRLSLLP